MARPKLYIPPGDKYGYLTVLREGEQRGNHRYIICRCECGSETSVEISNLRHGTTKSCGCLRNSKMEKGLTLRHGHTSQGGYRSPTYITWYGMKARCLNLNRRDYPRYGGRGITICDRWATSFENFLTDMGERPDGKTLDRIDNDGNYEPGNCRWATRSEQEQNKNR